MVEFPKMGDSLTHILPGSKLKIPQKASAFIFTARWCSGLTYWPVTPEIVGSNPIRVANLPFSHAKPSSRNRGSVGICHCFQDRGMGGRGPLRSQELTPLFRGSSIAQNQRERVDA